MQIQSTGTIYHSTFLHAELSFTVAIISGLYFAHQHYLQKLIKKGADDNSQELTVVVAEVFRIGKMKSKRLLRTVTVMFPTAAMMKTSAG